MPLCWGICRGVLQASRRATIAMIQCHLCNLAKWSRDNVTGTINKEQGPGWMCQMTLNGHGFATTKPIWMFLSKCWKAGWQSSGGVTMHNAIIPHGVHSRGTILKLCHHQSRGGITISKCHSCLTGDIVEALQCIKCAIWCDLLFQEPAPSSTLELEERDEGLADVVRGDSNNAEEESDIEGFSWDELLIEDEDKETMNCHGLGQAKPKPTGFDGFGLAQGLRKPKLPRASPKPGLSGQAGPEEH
ncbi:hypothetical protein F5148DRAFT_1147611 [Russula earlei]|uniref:Uncharacterized protein n=1 Tax=Russula earlei TaxID=71964 RepID=A0ACC0UFP0_9AGAM|nr:hypothetical protein F5148DRAFT_1147611 [Russula earlei]